MSEELKTYGEVYEDFSLKNNNTYGVDTKCQYFIKPYSIDSLIILMNYINENKINYFLIGGGSNLILPDQSFKGIVISLELLSDIEFDGNIVSCECGILLGRLVRLCVSASLSGLEYLASIPGTLGGALYGNAGVKDHTIYDNLISLDVLRNGEILNIKKSDIALDYRYSMFKDNNDIIVKAYFKLNVGNIDEMNSIIKENREKRLSTQPLEYKNAGSVFKNPEMAPAGKLIDELGLKGYHINDAQISTKHANFIVNKGSATSKDIKELISYIKKEVHEKYNIDLELEQIVVDWK